MQAIRDWLSENPGVVKVVVICAALVLIAALVMRVDLSWIPDLLREIVSRP